MNKQQAEKISASERVSASDLSEFVKQVFLTCGVGEDDAQIATDVSIYAQLRGSQSHGVLHLPLYVRGLLDETIKCAPEFEFEDNLPCTRVMDADNGLGLVASRCALDTAIELAKNFGMGAVAIRNSSHFGMAGYYVDYAAQQDLIAFSFTNASPAIAPTGSAEALFGTNPIGVGFPVPDADPIVVDMATAMVARSRIKQNLVGGKSIPEGWALDPDGQPTTDADLAVKGSVLPIGGPKGYGLALMVELLCTALSDGQPGFEVTYENQVKRSSRIGQFILVLNPDGFAGTKAYGKRAAHIADITKNAAAIDSASPPRLPGARGADLRRKYEADGIPMTQALKRALTDATAMMVDHATV